MLEAVRLLPHPRYRPGPDPNTRIPPLEEREFFIDNLLVRIHFIIEMIWWTGLAPWEFETPVPGSLISNFPGRLRRHTHLAP